MVNTAPKLFRALCSMMVMLALVAGIAVVPAFAAPNGIYIAAATPHYRNPHTGMIEDSGGESNQVLGQSMTESATHKQALVEVDADGGMYVTVRLKLMDNIENPQFQVDGSPVSATLMQEDYNNNTADYRMRVNSENSVIRCNMYVIAMGRDVIFFITVGNLQSGSGDFITSITVKEPANETPAPTVPQEEPANAQPADSPDDTKQDASSTAPASSAAEVNSETEDSQPSSSSELSSSEDASSEEEETALGLEEFDASGNEVSSAVEETDNGGGNNAAVWWIIGGIVVLGIAGGCVWYFCFFKKGKK